MCHAWAVLHVVLVCRLESERSACAVSMVRRLHDTDGIAGDIHTVRQEVSDSVGMNDSNKILKQC